ncbi:MAG TPA: alpha/beta hydrolase-fold protein [Phycisphaerae bacterium]|nr:alpha/beta hydrolase-fold protein [Phycisphaerae bacterium]
MHMRHSDASRLVPHARRPVLLNALAPALIAALAGLGGLIVAGCPGQTGNTDTVVDGRQFGPGTHSLNITANGRARTWTLHLPPTFVHGEPAPVVFLLHGLAGNGRQFLTDSGWDAAADTHGFIAVAPDALGANPNAAPNVVTNPRTWTATQFSLGGETTNRDVLFFDALLARVQELLGFSIDEVFVAGHSNGGSMTFVLASERGNRIAAAGIVASHWIGVGPAPDPAVPTLYIVGAVDPLAPLTGGATDEFGNTTPSINFTLTRWALALGCDTPAREVSDVGGLRTVEFDGCNQAATFRALFIEGQGHTWPGQPAPPLPEGAFGPATDLLDATATIWDFFATSGRAPS